MEPHAGQVRLVAEELAGAAQAVRKAELVVNATPVGMRALDASPVPGEWWNEGQVVYDMVYGTTEATKLLTEARGAGARAFDGLGMLVSQGATAIDIWGGTGIHAPRDVMRQAAERALAARTDGR